MLRALVLCLTIVAAFRTTSVDAAPLSQVAVTPAVAVVAERFGMDVSRDRGRFVAEIIRRIYSQPPSRQFPLNLPSALSMRASNEGRPSAPGPALAESGPSVLVDVPLSRAFWSEQIFKRQIPPDQWLAWILSDRRAALLCRGLLAADDETLRFYEGRPALLAFIYEHAPGAFAAFADSVRVRDGRLSIAGGAPAEALWEALIHVAPSDPESFIRALLIEPGARVFYLFDTLHVASPAARAFALGLWIDDAALRAQRFQALAAEVRGAFREWHVEDLSFTRPLNDFGMLLLRIQVEEGGAPARPSQRRFWADALGASPSLEAGAVAPPTHTRIDAAWLVQATAGDMYARGDKLDQFAFGQRVFGAHPDGESDTAVAIIREMHTRRMLLLGLERMGVHAPTVYAAAVKQAHDALEGGGERFWTVSQHQAVLALIVRMVLTDALTPRDGEALVQSFVAVPIVSGEFRGALAEWFQTVLGPKLPAGPTWRARAAAGAAGGPTPGRPYIDWEGERYQLDLAAGERHRIEAVQDKQGGPDLDVAFAVTRLGRQVVQASTLDAVRPFIAAAHALVAESGATLARPAVSTLPPGVTARRDGREWLTRAVDDLERAVRGGDLRRVARTGESLVELGDVATAHALLSLIYAVHLGDPDGPALMGANVALRHDFGFGRRDSEGRARGAWAAPRQDFQPGVPWHVTGSLVGLDVALAPLSLHRLSMDGLPTPPKLPSIERESFATNVALLNARRLGDIDRDRIAAAIRKGRARIATLTVGSPGFEKLKDEIALDGWRARTLAWVLQNEPKSVENQFSLAELLVLGEPRTIFDAWGANGQLTYGCVCTRFPGPRTWRVAAGRPQQPMLAATTVEMSLELALRFAAARLPAALLPSVLETAMQDFVDQVDTADPGDRLAATAYPRALSRTALEDAVAATATLDGPLVPDTTGPADR